MPAPACNPGCNRAHARTRAHAIAGDLKSVVLHKMTLSAQKSTFPIALGVRMTGVDDSCFSQTGGKASN